MPVLTNVRHERFAQELAAGTNATEAYAKAGYSHDPKGANAHRLLTGDDRISARVRELQGKGALRAEVTVEWLLQTAQAIINEARAAEDFTAASATLERAAKIAGKWVERSESKSETLVRDITDEPLTPDQWAEQYVSAH